jgi:rare lipoprotein A
MNKKLGLSLMAILLTATHNVSAETSTEDTIRKSMAQKLEQSFLSSSSGDDNPSWSSWLEAFNPSRHPNPPSEQTPSSNGIISYFYEYEIDHKPAATLYVNKLPVVTFLNENSTQNAIQLSDRINQLYNNNLDPETITAHWNADSKTYTINVGEEVLLTMNNNVILADTTQNMAEDTRQAANRLRRLLSGNTIEYLSEVEGQAQAQAQNTPSNARVVQEVRGVASWYGPGFHGRQSASGERFNQNALTAAHRSLPFGTMVRVTNLNNGRAVVVRINDRGPYSGGRILDLSAGAAQQIGMISTGVAPIRLEILR